MFDEDVAVIDDQEIDIEEPKDFAVIYLNDNYSSFDLVTMTLIQICHKSKEEAELITKEVHTKGMGIGYTGTEDICRTKQLQITSVARKLGMPLKIHVAEL